MSDFFKDGERIPIPRHVTVTWEGVARVVVWELLPDERVTRISDTTPVDSVNLDTGEIRCYKTEGPWRSDLPPSSLVGSLVLDDEGNPEIKTRKGKFALRWIDEPAPAPEDFEDFPPTCSLTGADGENPDDCTTHEHE